MIWKFLKQNVLFPKGLNLVQHWVSRIAVHCKFSRKAFIVLWLLMHSGLLSGILLFLYGLSTRGPLDCALLLFVKVSPLGLCYVNPLDLFQRPWLGSLLRFGSDITYTTYFDLSCFNRFICNLTNCVCLDFAFIQHINVTLFSPWLYIDSYFKLCILIQALILKLVHWRSPKGKTSIWNSKTS